jgi:hypothetical protein
VGKPERKRLLTRWEDNIKVDVIEVGCGGMNGTYLAQDRNQWRTHVNMVMNC